MRDPVSCWQLHLDDTLAPVIQSGVAAGLPNDAAALSSALIRFGIEIGSQAAGLPNTLIAAYLRAVADALEARLVSLPALASSSVGRSA